MSDTAPVRPTQKLVLPGPPIDGPVTQLECPAGPPAPACATHRPSRVSVRCRGLLSPLRTTLTVTPRGAVSAAAAGMAAPASTAPARTAADKRRIGIPPRNGSRRYCGATDARGRHERSIRPYQTPPDRRPQTITAS